MTWVQSFSFVGGSGGRGCRPCACVLYAATVYGEWYKLVKPHHGQVDFHQRTWSCDKSGCCFFSLYDDDFSEANSEADVSRQNCLSSRVWCRSVVLFVRAVSRVLFFYVSPAATTALPGRPMKARRSSPVQSSRCGHEKYGPLLSDQDRTGQDPLSCRVCVRVFAGVLGRMTRLALFPYASDHQETPRKSLRIGFRRPCTQGIGGCFIAARGTACTLFVHG